MKKLYLLLSLLLLSTTIKAQNPDAFITTWTVFGSGSYLTITIPIVQDSTNNYTVDFGDGTILTNQTGSVSHTYNSQGTYTVAITGVFKRINFGESVDIEFKLKTIEQWGTNQWESMEDAFRKCNGLIINATDSPDLSNVTSTKGMFRDCGSCIGTSGNLNNWDVSNVTDMSNMFNKTTSFNQPLNNWDVSNVTNMGAMFYNASTFNQSLNDWDVSNVTNMSSMFYFALSFNQPLNDWDVSNVTDMRWMFHKAPSFNQPLNNWNVSSVTTMASMFNDATNFNQPLNNWDVSNVTNMYMMFYKTPFNHPLNSWNVSNVTNMNGTFRMASSFNQDLSNWDVSNVTNMQTMFSEASSYNQDLSDWTFKEDVDLNHFVSNSGLDTNNYDALLMRFAQLQLQNITLGASNKKYCDVNVRNYLINELGWNIYGDSLGESCEGNTISGNILFDENNDGCDVNDILINNILINADNGTPYYSTLSANGEYVLNLLNDTYTVSLLNVPDYFIVTPENYTVSYTDFGNVEELNFCLTANQTIQDLNITLLPLTEARPGFEADYQLIVQNVGTQTVNNISVSFSFDDTMQSFLSAVPSPSSTTANQLNFEIASLSPFGSTVINFTMQTFAPPTVNGDDILSFSATVSPSIDDYTPYDNSFGLRQIVVNSYDPNDKLVLQGSEIHIDDVNEYLHYIVRFQNTGTASAIHVRIEDTLHESLDWNTIQILNSSHNYRVEIKDGNQMEFIFNNINLPYEDENEEGSNGFIAYKIKPIAGTQIGDFIIGNEAYIYFDYNLPIITNTTSTEVVEETSSVSVHNLNDLISVYPNPTNGVLHISSKGNTILEEVKIYNLQGRELFNSVQNLETIHIEDFSSGIYLMNIKTNQGIISKRVIKK